jgi:hypothetical protein
MADETKKETDAKGDLTKANEASGAQAEESLEEKMEKWELSRILKLLLAGGKIEVQVTITANTTH